MTATQSILPWINMDFDDQPGERRNDISRDEWESGINQTLTYLYYEPPNTTSRAVLSALGQTGKTVTVIPERQPMGQAKIGRNAHADPVDPEAATAKGKTSEAGTTGIGGGSSSKVSFVPQDWSSVDQPARLDVVDEVLLHELIHSLRQAKGLEDNAHLTAPIAILARGDGSSSQLVSGTTESASTKYSQIYQNIEEFAGILLTNIYRSENGRPGLVRDHLGDNELIYPLTNARNFLTVWRTEIARLCDELPIVCDQVAGVRCHFNPIFEYYVQKNWI